jgi:hypothetical protein
MRGGGVVEGSWFCKKPRCLTDSKTYLIFQCIHHNNSVRKHRLVHRFLENFVGPFNESFDVMLYCT